MFHDNHADLTDASGKRIGNGGVLATGVRYNNRKEIITVQSDAEGNRAVFSENSAYYGGVMYINSSQTHSIRQADFNKNQAFYGGVFFLNNESATFSDVKMTDNIADRGGCFYITGNCKTIKIENSSGSENTSCKYEGIHVVTPSRKAPCIIIPTIMSASGKNT